MKTANQPPRLWWEREDLCYQNNTLFLANHDLYKLAQSAQTPVFVYSANRIRENLNRLCLALENQQLDYTLYYALKANRYLPIISYLRFLGKCGMDVCSPNELLLSRQTGFEEKEISYTGTCLSDEDLNCLVKHPDVWVNFDSISVIKRFGKLCPGRKIGIRINPRIGLGYNQSLHYAGNVITKFGIYKSRFAEALETARQYDLKVTTLHFHCGSGYLSPQLDNLENILESAAWFLDQCPDIDTIDIGGGLGVPQAEGDELLDLERWSSILGGFFRARKLKIAVEPGDYLVKDSGMLILQVNTVEQKEDVRFVGVNGGMNLQYEPAFYHMNLEIAPLKIRPGSGKEKYTVAGNINEPIDIFAKDVIVPAVEEGDYIALINAGGYGSSPSSNHCMRGRFSEYLLFS